MADASDKDRASDLLIQEVDEDLRREQYQRLWRRYGAYAIAGAVAIVIVVAGWQAWQGWQKRQRLEEAGRYAAALALIDAGKSKEAEGALAVLSGDSSGFAVLAGMRRAELLAQDGDRKGAESVYEQIAASRAPSVLRDLAAIKEGLLALDDTGDTAAIEARVAALAVITNPWHFQATELQALFARKKGDQRRAAELFKQLADDAQAPAGLRDRAAEMLAAQPASGAVAPPTAMIAPGPVPAPAPAPAAPAAQENK